jgi:hypothetical protein
MFQMEVVIIASCILCYEPIYCTVSHFELVTFVLGIMQGRLYRYEQILNLSDDFHLQPEYQTFWKLIE